MAYFNNKKNIKGGGYIPSPVPSSPSYNPPEIPSSEEGSGVDIPVPSFSGNGIVTLYYSADESNRVDKKLSGAKPFEIIIKEETPVLNPVIILQSDTDLTYYNYAYIDLTGRYYYCEITLIENGFYSISMEVDVLMSHKEGIRRLIGLVDRTENQAYINKDLANDSLVSQRGTTTKIVKYKTSLDKDEKGILIVAGKPIPLG